MNMREAKNPKLKEIEEIKVTAEKTIVEYSDASSLREQEPEQNQKDCNICPDSTESKQCAVDESAPALEPPQQIGRNSSEEEPSLSSLADDELIAERAVILPNGELVLDRVAIYIS